MPRRSLSLRPGGSPTPRDAALSTALKNQTRELLSLADDDIVLISQLDCTEPGCPPVETVVAVLPPSGATRRWTLHHRLAEITPELLAQTLAEPQGAPEGDWP